METLDQALVQAVALVHCTGELIFLLLQQVIILLLSVSQVLLCIRTLALLHLVLMLEVEIQLPLTLLHMEVAEQDGLTALQVLVHLET
jgi:hypothetical protein